MKKNKILSIFTWFYFCLTLNFIDLNIKKKLDWNFEDLASIEKENDFFGFDMPALRMIYAITNSIETFDGNLDLSKKARDLKNAVTTIQRDSVGKFSEENKEESKVRA